MRKNPVGKLPRYLFLTAFILPIVTIAHEVYVGNMLLTGATQDLVMGAAAFFMAYGLNRVFAPGVVKPSVVR